MELNEKELGAVAGGKSEMVPVKVGEEWRLVKEKDIKKDKYNSLTEALNAADEKNGKKKNK